MTATDRQEHEKEKQKRLAEAEEDAIQFTPEQRRVIDEVHFDILFLNYQKILHE
jgi:hypothetical protein